MTPMPSPEAPLRRVWIRYRLRTALIIVTLLSIWLGWTANRTRTQRRAVALIQSAGGNIHFDYEESGPRTWSTAGEPRGSVWLRRLLGPEYFDQPVYVALYKNPKAGRWVDAVNELPTIKTLLLSGPNVSDDTLAQLKWSNSLIELHLSNTSITDDGLQHLSKFPNLKWLILNNTSITDTGIMHLSALQNLQELNLNSTKVSDQSLPVFVGLPDLQKIDLRRTLVSVSATDTFRADDPKLKVLQ